MYHFDGGGGGGGVGGALDILPSLNFSCCGAGFGTGLFCFDILINYWCLMAVVEVELVKVLKCCP